MRVSKYLQDFISLYLKPKVLGQKLPCNIVEEIQLYGPDANPWQLFHPENHSWLFSEVTPGKFEKVTYVFVNLSKRATGEEKKKSKRDYYTKKAGCGTWDGQTKRTPIRDCNGDLIGERRMLVFEINSDSDQDLDLSKVGYWKMHEYHLCGINDEISNPGDTVLCKITFDCSKKPPVKSCSKGNQDYPMKSGSKPQKKNTNVDIMISPLRVNSGCVKCNQGVSENSEGAITTQTRHNVLVVVSDSYKVKEKEGCSGTENAETSDGVECVNSCYVEDDIAVSASSPSEQVKTGFLNPSIHDFHWPAKKIKVEGCRGDMHFDMTEVQFREIQSPKKSSQLNTNLQLRLPTHNYD